MAEQPGDRIESAAEKAFKRRFGGKDKGRDKREDYALDLFREAAAYLDDHERVNRVLRELGKLYNPVKECPNRRPGNPTADHDLARGRGPGGGCQGP